ncbi:MAG: GrpB family protein [Eubacteriales bacterium]|nr:GrpB family protein [Eubacteriales bacterium]
MLGLVRGRVALQEHREEWAEAAQETIARLASVLAGEAVEIEHVGSTAVRGICAKPIIDIAVGMRSPEALEAFLGPLAQAGFIDRGEDVPGQRLLVLGDDARQLRTHHIHVVPWGGQAWRNYINFRDYLNAHPEQAARYDALKRTLAAAHACERGAYTAGKAQLVAELLERARVWKAAKEREGEE